MPPFRLSEKIPDVPCKCKLPANDTCPYVDKNQTCDEPRVNCGNSDAMCFYMRQDILKTYLVIL